MPVKTTEKKKMSFGAIIVLAVFVVAAITAIYLLINYDKAPTPVIEENKVKTIEYRDVSIDMNGDGILDYVIYAEVIIVGENQNLP